MAYEDTFIPGVSVDASKMRDYWNALTSLEDRAETGDEVALDIAAGFTPGVGTAQGARDLIRGLKAGDPLEAGLGAVGMIPLMGGVTKSAKALAQALRGRKQSVPLMEKAEAKIAAGKGDKVTKDEARAAGYPEEAYWHPVGTTKLPIPRGELRRTVEVDPTLKLLDPKQTSIEALEGSTIMRAPGDRSDIGQILTGVGDTELARPVTLEGGHGYMRRPGAAWASGKSVIGALRRRAAETPGDVNLMYFPMSHQTADFNTMMSDVLLEEALAKKLPKKLVRDFDERVRKVRPEWAGLHDPAARAQLEKTGALRAAFVEAAGLKDFQKAGFPDLGVARAAISDPALMNVKTGEGGQSIARLADDLTAVESPHSTYGLEVPGEYVGGLEEAVPYQLLFPDWYAGRKSSEIGLPTAGDYRSFSMPSAFHTQKVTPEVVDTVSEYLRALRQQ